MFAIKYFFLHHHHHKYPSMYAHRILRLIALLLPFLAGRASASSEEGRPKVKHAERLLSKLDPDGELLLRAFAESERRDQRSCLGSPDSVTRSDGKFSRPHTSMGP